MGAFSSRHEPVPRNVPAHLVVRLALMRRGPASADREPRVTFQRSEEEREACGVVQVAVVQELGQRAGGHLAGPAHFQGGGCEEDVRADWVE